MKEFDAKLQQHWPIIREYHSKQLSLAQTEAQLKDLGMVEWELRLYLDNDQECDTE